MGILVSEIRIRNFRSIKSIDIFLDDIAILIGQNNVGKTSVLSAINLAFGGIKYCSSEDIYISKNEKLSKSKKAIIDILIKPCDKANIPIEEFSEFWVKCFGTYISSSSLGDEYFAFRTIVSYDNQKSDYIIEKKVLKDWVDSEDVESYDGYKENLKEKALEYMPVFYMEAQRDIVAEMKEKKSFFGKMASSIELDVDELNEIEEMLNKINEKILKNSSVLENLNNHLNKISETIDASNKKIEINPVSRKIRDLNKGIDISFQDFESDIFSVSRHGMGTRSWISFLTLMAFISWKTNSGNDLEFEYHPIVLIEEPEAHLHPQAQRHLLNHILEIDGQKIVSTHSSVIAGQVDFDKMIKVSKNKNGTQVKIINKNELQNEDLRKIKRMVLNTRGDILFSNAIILCEGETEEQALPIFFNKYFSGYPFEFGINIISVNGDGGYKPYLILAKYLDIPYFIFSDGEPNTRKKVGKTFKKVFPDQELYEKQEIIILDEGDNFEKYLVKEKYNEALINILNKIKIENGGDSISQEYLEKLKTKEELSDEELINQLKSKKTKYSSMVADEIINKYPERPIPQKILELFYQIEKLGGRFKINESNR